MGIPFDAGASNWWAMTETDENNAHDVAPENPNEKGDITLRLRLNDKRYTVRSVVLPACFNHTWALHCGVIW